MKIRNVRHSGLQRFIESGRKAGLPVAACGKIGRIVAFLQDMQSEAELAAFPYWKPHKLQGDRKGTWSLNITPNWRITFEIDEQTNEIFDLDYEDTHQ